MPDYPELHHAANAIEAVHGGHRPHLVVGEHGSWLVFDSRTLGQDEPMPTHEIVPVPHGWRVVAL